MQNNLEPGHSVVSPAFGTSRREHEGSAVVYIDVTLRGSLTMFFLSREPTPLGLSPKHIRLHRFGNTGVPTLRTLNGRRRTLTARPWRPIHEHVRGLEDLPYLLHSLEPLNHHPCHLLCPLQLLIAPRSRSKTPSPESSRCAAWCVVVVVSKGIVLSNCMSHLSAPYY